jgi:hypothetical protein
MGKTSKSLASILVLIITMSIVTLLIAKPSFAESITKPSVPQFTLKLVDASVVQITIQNQPLVLTLENESLYYNVRVKGHLEDKWTELYTLNNLDQLTLKGTIPIQSNSSTTVLSYSISGYPQNTEEDFQVIAMYGDYITSEPASHDPFVPSFTSFGIIADGESGWSPTQTITVPAFSVSPSSTPKVPELPLWTIPLLLIIMVVAGLSFYFKKNTHGKGEWV